MEKRVEKLETDVAAIKVNVATILANYATKADIGELRSDMHKATADVQKWMIATIIGLFIGFGGLFITMSNVLRPIAPSTPVTATQPAPIIITVPMPAPEAVAAKRKAE